MLLVRLLEKGNYYLGKIFNNIYAYHGDGLRKILSKYK